MNTAHSWSSNVGKSSSCIDGARSTSAPINADHCDTACGRFRKRARFQAAHGISFHPRGESAPRAVPSVSAGIRFSCRNCCTCRRTASYVHEVRVLCREQDARSRSLQADELRGVGRRLDQRAEAAQASSSEECREGDVRGVAAGTDAYDAVDRRELGRIEELPPTTEVRLEYRVEILWRVLVARIPGHEPRRDIERPAQCDCEMGEVAAYAGAICQHVARGGHG